MEFDRLLLKEDYINPVRYLATGHIHPNRKNASVIAPFFHDVTPELIEKSMRSMIFCIRCCWLRERREKSDLRLPETGRAL